MLKIAHSLLPGAPAKAYKYRYGLPTTQYLCSASSLSKLSAPRSGMKSAVLLSALLVLCTAAPAPDPAPAPKPAPKPNPSLLFPAPPAIITSPVVSYSHYFKSPLYPAYQPYVYNLGYASGYSYNAYPYYVPLHLI